MAIGERYEVKKILGQGGNAKVYLVYDRDCGKNRAVKAVKKTGDGQAHHIVKTETELIRKLNYPYFPEIIEMLETADTDYIVMEYLEGESLGNRLRRMGPQSQKEVLRWGKDLSLMLDYLHHCSPPVIYRDMKPDNIMVCPGGSLRLVDFGAAGFRNFGEESAARMAFSDGFTAPEQRGEDGLGVRADERSDIYAFGKTLCYMVTGAVCDVVYGMAFPASYYNPLLSEALEAIIERCTEAAPEARYQVAGEVMRDLNRKEIRGKGRRGQAFVRHVEKQICLTDCFRL